MQRITLSICVLLFSILNVHSQLNDNLSVNCSKTESVCGDACYDSKIQNCTTTKVVQCKANCSDSCYDPTTQQCLNGTICGTNEQSCFVKYNQYGSPNIFPSYRCYNPLNQTCLNNSICSYPSRVCNNQCVSEYQVCVDNTTICDADILVALNYETHSMKLCNGSCYNSEIHECKNNSIKCIDSNCFGTCYNSSLDQCINGTICEINSKMCTVSLGSESSSQCYDPSREVCLNNSVCLSSRICNQQCLGYKQMCVDNTTICDMPLYFFKYESNQIKLCHGKCYDSKIQQCINDSVQCIGGTCFGKCYNSSTQQCLNGTICDLNKQVCDLKYGSNRYQCYSPTTQACLNDILCDYPSRLCNQRCLQDYQICVNNETICNTDDFTTYKNFAENQMKLCNGQCYNSKIRQCIDKYEVKCIKYPYLSICPNSSREHKSSFVLLMSILIIVCAFVR